MKIALIKLFYFGIFYSIIRWIERNERVPCLLYFSLPSSIVKHSERESVREKREGKFFDKSSMEGNSCSTAGEMYLTLFHHHILLYFSTKIESLAFSSRAAEVKCEGLMSGPAV